MKFKAKLELHGKSATGIEVPAKVMDSFGSAKKPAVVVDFGSYSYRTTVGVMSGKSLIPVSAEHRRGAGIEAGDTVEVELTLDEAPREVDVPDDVASAMADAKVRASFDALSFSVRKEHVRSIESAKTQETRDRRIAKLLRPWLLADQAASALITVNVKGLTFQGRTFACVAGSGGVVPEPLKREGDRATPTGTYGLRKVHYRPDRVDAPLTELPVRAITSEDGWCDESTHAAYNQLVVLPHDGSYEDLWREDHVYDVIVEIGYNDRPAIPGRGSAIFLHLFNAQRTTTDGCIAIDLADLLFILSHSSTSTRIRIETVD